MTAVERLQTLELLTLIRYKVLLRVLTMGLDSLEMI